jgi:hypothetical protein
MGWNLNKINGADTYDKMTSCYLLNPIVWSILHCCGWEHSENSKLVKNLCTLTLAGRIRDFDGFKTDHIYARGDALDDMGTGG